MVAEIITARWQWSVQVKSQAETPPPPPPPFLCTPPLPPLLHGLNLGHDAPVIYNSSMIGEFVFLPHQRLIKIIYEAPYEHGLCCCGDDEGRGQGQAERPTGLNLGYLNRERRRQRMRRKCCQGYVDVVADEL